MSEVSKTGDGPPADALSSAQALPPFKWGALATVGWSVTIAVVVFSGVLLAIFAISAIELFQKGVDPEIVGADDMVGAFVNVATDYVGIVTVFQTLLIIAMVWLLTRPGGGLRRSVMLGLEPISLKHCLKWTAFIFVIVIVLTEVPQLFVDIGQKQALEWVKILRPVWLAFVLLVILAPLSEELLFRGFIYGGLSRSALGPAGTILVTAAVWTVIHVQYTWLIMSQVFIYGVVFGVARWKSGSLWPPIVAHGIINLIAGIMAFAPSSG